MLLFKANCKVLLIFVLALLSSKSCVVATNIFSDDFTKDLSKWVFVGEPEISGSFYLDNTNGLVSDIPYEKSAILKIKNMSFGDFVFEASVVNVEGVDQEFVFRLSEDNRDYYKVGFRYLDPNWDNSGDTNNIRLFRVYGNGWSTLRDSKFDGIFKPNLTKGVLHKIKVIFDGSYIEVFFDDNKVFDYEDTGAFAQPLNAGGVGIMGYAGTYWPRVMNYYKKITIDNFEMGKKRYVVVPGLGASWNPRAMVGVVGGEWTMTPFVANYDNLINLLAQKTGENPLVWNYDWREPIGNIVPKFNDFVSNQVEEDEKVEVIGHSLGGLVGRIWQQEFDDNPRVDRVITLGSPHKGATKAYETWMGAYVSGKLDMGAVATKVLIMLNRFKAKTEVGVVRNLAPVIKDLLPVYNFASKNGSELGWQTMMFPNSYIGELNNQYAGNDNLINIVANAGSNTLYKLELGPASKLDKMLGYWAEGKPKTRITSDGDGTVLVLSAGLDNTKKIDIFSSHGNMPDNSRAEILGELNLENESFSMNNQVDDNIYFYLGSPATMTVDCDKSNPVADTAGWVVIPKGGNQSCLVELRGTGDGEYHLVAGLDRGWEDWDAWEGIIKNGEVTKWKVELNKMILVPQEARDWWGRIEYLIKALLERYPRNHNLKLALRAVENKRLGQLKAQMLVFNLKNKDLTVTSEIIKAIYFLGRQDKSNSKAVESVFEHIWRRQYQENRLAGWWRLGEELL